MRTSGSSPDSASSIRPGRHHSRRAGVMPDAQTTATTMSAAMVAMTPANTPTARVQRDCPKV
jgi:hypothetical protein